MADQFISTETFNQKAIVAGQVEPEESEAMEAPGEDSTVEEWLKAVNDLVLSSNQRVIDLCIEVEAIKQFLVDSGVKTEIPTSEDEIVGAPA